MLSKALTNQTRWLLMVFIVLAGLAGARYAPPMARWEFTISRAQTVGALFILAVALTLYRPTRRGIAAAQQYLHVNTAAGAIKLGVIVAIVSSAYLLAAALLNGRELAPRLHDEKSYVLQSRMMAHGMLWRAPHPLPDSFETFFVSSTPVYGSKYFPGAMMLYVPGVWLGLPDWVTSLLIAGAVSGMTCLVAIELLDGQGAWGVLASLLLLSVDSFRDLGTWILSHESAMLGALLMTYFWLRWRKTASPAFAIALGLAAGWSAITRPIDVLAYAIPLAGLAMWDLIRRAPHATIRAAARDLLLIGCGAAPFLALQLVFNHGVTGNWFQTPYRAYIDRYQPGTAFAAVGSPGRPQTTLRQKIEFYDRFVVPIVKEYRARGPWAAFRDDRFILMARHAMGNRLQWLFLPAALLAVFYDRRMLLPVLAAPMFAALYVLNPYMMWYYPIIVAPAVSIATVAGAVALIRMCPANAAPCFGVLVLLSLAAIALGSIPELFLNFYADKATASTPRAEKLVQLYVKPPALVFYRYESFYEVHAEPVYNLTTGWPDDEPITRAQDLGTERDIQLLDYYARFQPNRRVYLVERGALRMAYLGTVAEARQRFSALLAASRPASSPSPATAPASH